MTPGDHDDPSDDDLGFHDDLDDDGWGGDGAADDPLGRLRDLAEGDPRVQAGVEHLQRAAREVIAASRALLDVADDLVEDPKALGGLVGLLGSVGDVAARLSRAAGPAKPWAGGHEGGGDADDDGDEPPVQRIPVS
ncbi:hypothetical protein KSP35_05740 [Aquihabitans sp. G128]|uniref:hypothetical protein n=1 Tax=Aquihabitans sp. G128 TaxID=2849779 RepID=UPI001C24A2BD|nr:hypothetical protein [Aquihabitans sp. G128]QXC62306.1 hypothetical protein KSP35_05740 [Aquihabitans sp. G128]